MVHTIEFPTAVKELQLLKLGRFKFKCSDCMWVTVTALYVTAFFDSQKHQEEKQISVTWITCTVENLFPSMLEPPATVNQPTAARNHSWQWTRKLAASSNLAHLSTFSHLQVEETHHPLFNSLGKGLLYREHKKYLHQNVFWKDWMEALRLSVLISE